MKIETQEQIERFKEFMESYYLEDLHRLSAQGINSIKINFADLAEFDHELADDLLEDPEDTIRASELAIEQIDLSIKNFKTRFYNLPKDQVVLIREIRSIHLNKFMAIEGIVRQSSDVRPQVTSAKFECPACGTTITLLQLDTKFREPTRCSCGRRGRFRLISKELVDAQRLVLEEVPESLESGEQPKRLSVFLKEDLVEPKMEKHTTPGSKVIATGIIKEVPIMLKSGAQSIRYDLMMETNYIDPIERTFWEVELNEKDEEEIKSLSQDPKVFEKLVKSVAPSIYGHERVKEALVLQLMGGTRKVKEDGTVIRGDLHILLVGDPGAAKSTLLTSVSKISPKGRLVSGKSVSGVGLCIAPDSLVLTNPGGIFEIKEIVEDNLKNNEKLYHNGVWNAINPESKKKIFTLDENLKIKPQEISQFWRIDAPEYMIKLKTRMGKEIIVTLNTKIYDSDLSWKEAMNLKKGDYIATIRDLKFEENKDSVFTLDLIKSNPVIRGIKDKVKFLIEEACKKKSIDKRTLARNLNINELSIYHNWVNKKARGNIKLKSLKLLSNYAEIPLEKIIDNNARFSLYGNHSIKLPIYLNEDLLYLAGLIAGDGDLSKGKNSVTIRFSNNSKELMNKFINISKNLFDVKANLSSKKSNKRAESWRFSSKLVYEILESLGIPISPKSYKIDMSNILLKTPNDLLSYYLRGYFDADGGCVENIKGSNYIESSSTSKIFSEKLKLVLLRYGLISKIREKKANPNIKIKSKYNKFIISIQGKESLERFKNFIGFNHPEKYEKLNRIINKISKVNTNIDVIPNAKSLIKEAEKNLKTKLTYRRGKSHISRNYLSNLINNIKPAENENIRTLNKLANSDIFWDKVNEIEIIKNHNYDYVYDLTVENSHNFIVNGILVHNTASVVKDEFLRGWALEAGAMVLANGGQLFIDELDKMSDEDRDALHEALEQQRISVAKANIHATLRAQTTVLAAANPKLGRFDPYTPLASQIDLPPTLINRFDLIFPIRDLPNTELDTKIATHVLSLQQNPEDIKFEVPIMLFKKYISYAKQKITPKLTDEAIHEIKSFYVALRNTGQRGEGELRPIPISARQLEALVRLSEGSARTRLSTEVKREDAIRAINLLKHCLMEVGFDYETGQIDIDRITTGVTTSQRSRIITLRDIIKKLENKVGKIISLQEVIDEANNRDIDKAQVEEIIEQLKREGYLFEPKKGQISLL